MPLIELKIPPGIRQTGTDLQSEGRWRDGNLVRWRDGALSPVGGWTSRGITWGSTPRGMLTWEDNTNNRWIAFGTYNNLVVYTSGGTSYNITPTGFTSGNEFSALSSGYGAGYYDQGLYGTTRSSAGSYSEATTWSLDTWGQYLVACSVDDGKLYEWQLNTASDAAAITNSPTDCLGLVVTEERFLFALGAGGDTRKIAWCDFEDNTTWAAASTNQAGDHTLQTQGRIMAGIRAQGQTLIVTDLDAHRAIYTGPPFIYQFERVGEGCGLVSRKAIASTPAGVFWMGQHGFFRYDGASVSPIPCEVTDAVFGDLNRDRISHSWAVSNSQFNEVWFFYPSDGASDVDRYVIYNYVENHWSLGSLERTTGVDRGVFRNPIWLKDGSGYNHEVGNNYATNNFPYVESGPFKIGAGDNTAHITKIIPDEDNLGSVRVWAKTRFYPTSAESTHGPFTVRQPTDARIQGRQIRLRLEAANYVLNSTAVSDLLNATTGYFDQLVDGRKLGDIDNDGDADALDAAILLAYVSNPTGVTDTYRAYIEGVIIPTIMADEDAFALYMDGTPTGDFRIGNFRVEVQAGGKR